MEDGTVEHRWSGWPGAWCLDCGIEDMTEICISTHEHSMVESTPENPMGIEPQCLNPECLEPGSNRFNPYVRGNEDDRCQT